VVIGRSIVRPRTCNSQTSLGVLPTYVWEMLVILALILANGFFAAAEIAIIASRRGRLQQQANAGDRRARIALELATDPNRFLPTVQVGITLVGTFAAVFGGAHLVDTLSESLGRAPLELVANNRQALAVAIVALGIAYVTLILGELTPKRLALRRAEALARFVAPVMDAVARLARPFVWFMGASTNAVLLLLRARSLPEPTVSLEDIRHLIDTGTAEGVLEPVEQRVALEALRLGERMVRDVMRPRIDLDALDIDTPPDEVIGAAAMAGFSRLPVYEGDLDHIVGYVHIKDLLRQLHLGWPIDLRRLLHPPLFVPETMPLDRLLQLFQTQKNQLAIVLDEYGGTEGLVTLEDVVEELVGEIGGVRHDAEQMFVQRDNGTWLVDGGATVDDLIERLGLAPPGAHPPRNFSTVSGLILHRLGKIPAIGEAVEWNGLRLEVVDMDGQRIDRIWVSPIAPPTDSADAAASR
jgi:putative hemolysin